MASQKDILLSERSDGCEKEGAVILSSSPSSFLECKLDAWWWVWHNWNCSVTNTGGKAQDA